MRGRLRRAVTGAGAALVLIAVPAATALPAYAGPAPGRADVIGNELVFTAGLGVDNVVEFYVHIQDGLWHVKDASAGITAGADCEQVASKEVRCTGVLTILAVTLDGNDKLGVREKVSTLTAARGRASVGTANDQASMILLGGPGNDKLTGGWGDDLLDGGTGADVLEDWAGVDTATYADRSHAVVADLDGAYGDDGEPREGDTIPPDVENLVGGAGDDTLIGGDGSNVLRGGAGPDRLLGQGGGDQLFGNAGYDFLDGGANLDACFIGVDSAQTTDCEAVYN